MCRAGPTGGALASLMGNGPADLFLGKKKYDKSRALSLSEPFMYYILLSTSRVKNHVLELIKMLPIWIVLKDNLY